MNVDCMGFEFTPQLVLALISIVMLVGCAGVVLSTSRTGRLRPLPVDAALHARWPWRDRLLSVPPECGVDESSATPRRAPPTPQPRRCVRLCRAALE